MNGSLGKLDKLPRVALAHLPTPLEAMDNLAAALGRTGGLYVKRDDCTGLAFGGNKVRHLEFYLGVARARGADTVLITGAIQSNFSRCMAAAARKLGMGCHIQLEDQVPDKVGEYRTSGNVLVDNMLGATLHAYTGDPENANGRIDEIADALKAEGRNPYVVPRGAGHKPLGALGYVVAAQEILTQIGDRGIRIDEIVLASGTGASQAGLLFGLRALGSDIRVTGVCVREESAIQKARVAGLCGGIAEVLEVDPIVRDEDVIAMDDFLAPGYGRLNEPTLRALDMAARHEALILDPAYTAKAMATAILRARETGPDYGIMFLHTGGEPGAFAYSESLTAELEKLRAEK